MEKKKIKQTKNKLSEADKTSVKNPPLRNKGFDKHNQVMSFRLVEYFKKDKNNGK